MKLCLTLLMLCLTAKAQFLIDPYRFGCPALTAYAAGFDGSNDYLNRNGALVGVVDAKTATIAFWIDMTGQDGASVLWFSIHRSGSDLNFTLQRNSSNKLTLLGRNAAGTVILDAITTSYTMVAATGWVHVMWCVDMANSSNRHLFINGSDTAVTWTTYTDDTLDLSVATGTAIGAHPNTGTPNMAASISELWFDDIYFDDPTKFICVTHPISLGDTGEVPTGSAPEIYLSKNGSGNSWATDSSGNSNTFTVIGGGLTSPDSP